MRAVLAAVLLLAVLASPAGAAQRHPWFRAADARCTAATGEAKRLLRTIPRIRTQADAFAFVRKGLRINEQLVADLHRAAPAGDRGVAAFLGHLDRGVRLDRDAVAALERDGRTARFDRLAAQGQAAEAAARRQATQLGLRGCARYLDPQTYK